MLTWDQKNPPAGRILAHSGEIMVGWVHPTTKPIQWQLDVPGHKVSGKKHTVESAKRALADAWAKWCKRAGVVRA